MKLALAAVLGIGVGLALMAISANAGTNCTCRADGAKFEVGELRCVRGRLSRCIMFLNNPSWKTIADVCPEASAQPQKQALPFCPA